jgi:hypothetical protein
VACEAGQNSILTGSSELMSECASRAFARCAGRPIGLGNPPRGPRQFKYSNLLSVLIILTLLPIKGKRTIDCTQSINMQGADTKLI